MAKDDGGTSYIQGLYTRFNKIAVDIQNVHGKIDPSNPSTIKVALEELKYVISNLFELQEYQNGLPTVAATAEISASIAKEINDLMEQTKNLYTQLSSIAGKMPDNQGDESDNNDNKRSNVDENLNSPALTRDDLGKLFLLTAKAYSIKAISLEQRNKIKGEIILQKGYLRDLFLKESDIAEVLATMKAFPV